jgi:hypothetical protein
MTNPKFDAAAADALKNLKRLIAGGGKLQGNFYYITSKDAQEAALIVTLSAKDKKGSKAAGEGKKLRGELKGSKVARGTITVEGKKLTFNKQQGNAGPGLMKKGFRDVLSKEKGLAFIKKASISDSSGEEVEDDIDDIDDAEIKDGVDGDDIELSELEMTADELKELANQLRDDADLAAFFSEEDSTRRAAVAERDRLLSKHFLSSEAAEREEAELRAQRTRELQGRIDALKDKTDLTADERAELKAARAEFAKLQEVGPAPVPEEVGSSVPPETAVLLDTANDDNNDQVIDLHQRSAREVVERGRQLEQLSEDERSGFARTALSEVDPHYKATVEYTRVSKVLTGET